jgi:hypothetical protein
MFENGFAHHFLNAAPIPEQMAKWTATCHAIIGIGAAKQQSFTIILT